jgi:hypothetical protein
LVRKTVSTLGVLWEVAAAAAEAAAGVEEAEAATVRGDVVV